jgi:hypothetical protein
MQLRHLGNFVGAEVVVFKNKMTEEYLYELAMLSSWPRARGATDAAGPP